MALKTDFLLAITQLTAEKNLAEDVVFDAVESALAAAYKREIENAPDPDKHREMIEQRLLKMRSPMKAAQHFDVIDLIDPRDTRRLACTFVKLAQPMLKELSTREKRAVRP